MNTQSPENDNTKTRPCLFFTASENGKPSPRGRGIFSPTRFAAGFLARGSSRSAAFPGCKPSDSYGHVPKLLPGAAPDLLPFNLRQNLSAHHQTRVLGAALMAEHSPLTVTGSHRFSTCFPFTLLQSQSPGGTADPIQFYMPLLYHWGRKNVKTGIRRFFRETPAQPRCFSFTPPPRLW